MFISFITSVYNVNSYLGDFFESFKSFDIKKYEIIVIDDRGDEDPLPIIKKYDQLPIKYIKNEKNIGLGFSRNVGLEHISSKSTTVIYIDSDDAIDSNFLLEWISPKKIHMFSFYKWTKKKLIHKNQKERRHISTMGLTPFIWGIAIPVNIAKKEKFQSAKHEDIRIKADLVKKYEQDIFLDERVMIKYRIRKSSIVGQGVRNHDELLEYIKEYNYLVINKLYMNEKYKNLIIGRTYEANYWLQRRDRANSLLLEYPVWKKLLRMFAMKMQKLVLFKKWMRGFNQFD